MVKLLLTDVVVDILEDIICAAVCFLHTKLLLHILFFFFAYKLNF